MRIFARRQRPLGRPRLAAFVLALSLGAMLALSACASSASTSATGSPTDDI